MSDPDIYTVGWICAIRTEFTAARQFLDEEHELPSRASCNDNNAYTVGRIGKHNVVIALLPLGGYGVVPAAAVARDMLHSFPNIKIGLMVGIGGGAPSDKHDIRLGDVVVSCPGGGRGGIWQYDFGKDVQDQKFQHSGHLNQPPNLLLTSVNVTSSYIESGEIDIKEAVEEILTKRSKMRKKFGRPSTDRRFVATFLHSDPEKTCNEICVGPNDEAIDIDYSDRLYPRKSRTEDREDIEVFYGLIASGNTLMKNAERRDSYAKEGVLCFEMEAAGLLNHFPCLVIRGICDYSDTHKNKEWQGFAAMTAAAFATNLLNHITPRDVEAQKSLRDHMSSIDHKLDNVAVTAQKIKTSIEDTQAESQWREALSWLSPPDPSKNFKKALRQRHPGSGQWLLDSPRYLEWKEKPNSFLWLHGIPGCGKTVLSATIIENLSKDHAAHSLLYFYFDFADSSKQSLEAALRSLITQLCRDNESIRTYVSEFVAKQNKQQQHASIESLCMLFKQLVQQSDETWIVLDALDECKTLKDHADGGLLPWMGGLRLYSQTKIHLAVLSRPEQEIQTTIERWACSRDIVQIQSNLVEGDIKAYVHAVVREHAGLSRWSSRPKIQDEIQNTLIEKADGMFRWVACQLGSLEECRDPVSLRQALGALPMTLDDTYTRILKKIPAGIKQSAIRILQFLAYSDTPLSIEQAVDLIAIDVKRKPHFDPDNRMPVADEIAAYCSSLVVIIKNAVEDVELQYPPVVFDETLSDQNYDSEDHLEFEPNFEGRRHVGEDQDEASTDKSSEFEEHFEFKIQPDLEKRRYGSEDHDGVGFKPKISFLQLAHFSVKEYLTSNRVEKDVSTDLTETGAKASIVEICLAYLMGIVDHVSAAPVPWDGRVSCRSWLNEQTDWADLGKIGELFTSNPFPFAKHAVKKWLELVLFDEGFGDTESPLTRSLFEPGAPYMVVFRIWGHDIFPDTEDLKIVNFALFMALLGALIDPIKELLFNGADINFHFHLDEDKKTSPLALASGRGDLKLVQLLLEHGAKADTPTALNGLNIACRNGSTGIVRTLLDHGASPNARAPEDETALCLASQKGHLDVVHILLEHGADVDARGSDGETALSGASQEGHSKVVKLLLEHGADVDARGPDGKTALSGASREGHSKVVKLLLEHGADVDARGPNGQTALSEASKGGHCKVVKILLEQNADVNNSGGALADACVKGCPDIVRLLLSHGADVNSAANACAPIVRLSARGPEMLLEAYWKHYRRMSPLGAALATGNFGIARMLLDRGADINADNMIGIYLSEASSNGNVADVEMLLDHGANVNVCGDVLSPISAASSKGQLEMVRMLLRRGAWDETAVVPASLNGHSEVIQTLLNHGVNVNTHDKDGWSALSAASLSGDLDTMKKLLDQGADVNAGKEFGHSALSAASSRGHTDIMQMLLNRGAHDSNALIRACYYGCIGGVQMLLDHHHDARDVPAIAAALGHHHYGLVELLIRNGANVNTIKNKLSALDFACMDGKVKFVQLLLENGAQVNGHNPDLPSPLETAVAKGKLPIVRMLLDRGADVNVQRFGLPSPLHEAARGGGSTEMLQVLLSHGANVDAKFRGKTPLALALEYGILESVRMLLDAGSILEDPSGTAVAAAVYHRDEEIAQLLLERGAEVNSTSQSAVCNQDYGTALQWAAFRGNPHMTQILLDHGADVFAKNKFRDTGSGKEILCDAYQASLVRGRTEIAQMILCHGWSAADSIVRCCGEQGEQWDTATTFETHSETEYRAMFSEDHWYTPTGPKLVKCIDEDDELHSIGESAGETIDDWESEGSYWADTTANWRYNQSSLPRTYFFREAILRHWRMTNSGEGGRLRWVLGRSHPWRHQGSR